MSSKQELSLCYATASAGMHPDHILPLKLHAIASAGFTYTELAFPDLEAYAQTFAKDKGQQYKAIDDAGEGDLEKLLDAAHDIKGLCDTLKIKVLTVMPFSQFEGYGPSARREKNLNRAKAWFKVLQALGCQILQVGSSNDPDSSSDYNVIASDLQLLADEAAKQNPPITLAYEMWEWGVYVNSWESVWDIVQRVDRENFGMCLDTFQISAIYNTSHLPSSPSPYSLPKLPSSSLSESLAKLSKTITKDKIVYFQISDGSFASRDALQEVAETSKNIPTDEKPGIHPLYAWSNAFRPLPFQDVKMEGQLPVMDVIESVLKTGWRGPCSFEVFYAKEMLPQDSKVPEKWTKDAMHSFDTIKTELKKRNIEV